MISFTKGNIIEAQTEAIVNTVNTIGIMGKGIALRFKEYFPENFKRYEAACKRGEVQIGKMFVTQTGLLTNPRYIINFPTKIHWKQRSSYDYIQTGLDDLIKVIKEKNIKSISVPPLGCGNGRLAWKKVKTILEEKLKSLNDVQVAIYEPHPETEVVTEKQIDIRLTSSRALVLDLIRQYTVLGYEVTLLEVHKLAYFLQRFGEPLKLRFKEGTYGPFAENLLHLLKHLEGSFIKSDKKRIADMKPFEPIRLIEEKFSTVDSYIKNECTMEQRTRLSLVHKLIEGFESPFGMELLATVDWVIEKNQKKSTMAEIISKVQSWNSRKKELMKPEFIEVTYNALQNFEKELYLN